MSRKPQPSIQTTTLWEFPSQHYGDSMQGDKSYIGATPSYIIWNLVQRYTRKYDLVIDPMCGSGTTIDVCRDLGRKVIGSDINPYRKDIVRADARKIPVADRKVDLVFIDPPYSDHIDYSGAAECIGQISATDKAFFDEMEKVLAECQRVLKYDRHIGLYICDFFNKKTGFIPTGFLVYERMLKYFTPVDIVSVVRHNKSLAKGNWHKAAEEQNFFLRGFNYLFIMKRERPGLKITRPAASVSVVADENKSQTFESGAATQGNNSPKSFYGKNRNKPKPFRRGSKKRAKE